MIQYTLKCSRDHSFTSWFQSASAFDKLKAANMVICDVCGDTSVEKAVMAPRVRPARNAAAAPAADKDQSPLRTPDSDMEKAIATLKKHVESTSDYVGGEFVKEARAMHDGETPERSIYGEARPEDAKALIEDGIAVAPLPFRPGRKSN